MMYNFRRRLQRLETMNGYRPGGPAPNFSPEQYATFEALLSSNDPRLQALLHRVRARLAHEGHLAGVRIVDRLLASMRTNV
jgi:hypothetical protein